jgi:drug/metabolite transporter (DMT)-like permease
MNTVSWSSFLNSRYLLGLTLLASFFVLTSSYLSYIGIKIHPLSTFVPLFTLVYLVTTVMFGIGFLGEKINKLQAAGIVLAVIAIILIEYPKAASADS